MLLQRGCIFPAHKQLPADLGTGGGEISSLSHVHPSSIHGCGVQTPTGVDGKELLQLVTISKQVHSRDVQGTGSAVAFLENPSLGRKKVIRELQKAQEAQLAKEVTS